MVRRSPDFLLPACLSVLARPTRALVGVMPEHWARGGFSEGCRACHDAAPRIPHAEDLISAVEFDGTGEYLATGDRGGRVVIFESSEVSSGPSTVCT